MLVNIRWLAAKDLDALAAMAIEEGWIVDLFELQKIRERFGHLFYGAYEEDRLIGAISGYLHDKSGWIGNFIVHADRRGEGVGRRLFETLLRAIRMERETIYLNAAPQVASFYQSYGFLRKTVIGRYVNAGSVPPFVFTNQHAKELQTVQPQAVIKELDFEAFGEDRMTFLTFDLPHKSSLVLTSENGFCHSRIVNSRSVFVGPWIVRSGAFLDAEKMMRGLLYFRGLKKIYADIPEEVEEIRSLYKSYRFEKVGETIQMCLGEPLEFKYDDIYAFASTGTCG